MDNDNIADAVNLNFIGRAVLGWRACTYNVQQEIMANLLNPKVKASKKSKKPAGKLKVIKSLPELTDLGRRYAELPAAVPEKEALLLELCQCFHPYLMKYLVMICRGTCSRRLPGIPTSCARPWR